MLHGTLLGWGIPPGSGVSHLLVLLQRWFYLWWLTPRAQGSPHCCSHSAALLAGGTTGLSGRWLRTIASHPLFLSAREVAKLLLRNTHRSEALAKEKRVP